VSRRAGAINSDMTVVRAAWMKDPDGNTLAMTQRA